MADATRVCRTGVTPCACARLGPATGSLLLPRCQPSPGAVAMLSEQRGRGKAAQSAMLPAELSQLGAAARRAVKCRDSTGLCRISLLLLRSPLPAKSSPGKCDGTSLAVLVLFLPSPGAAQAVLPWRGRAAARSPQDRTGSSARTPGWLHGLGH